MPSASALRIQIEHNLERRFPAALTPVPRTIRETAATGIREVDRLLNGGLPVGAISEIAGPSVQGGRAWRWLFWPDERRRSGSAPGWTPAMLSIQNLPPPMAWLCASCSGCAQKAEPGGEAIGAAQFLACGFFAFGLFASGSGTPRHRSAAAGGRICCHRARSWLDRTGTGHKDSACNVVPLPPGCGPNTLLSAGAGTGAACAIERSGGAGVCTAARADSQPDCTAWLHV